MERYGDVDSKFRFVILASKRAKQLLHGAKPKIKSKSKNLIRIAQDEVRRGLVEYEIIQLPKDEHYEAEDEIFIGEEIKEEEERVEKAEAQKKKKPKKEAKKDVKKEPRKETKKRKKD